MTMSLEVQIEETERPCHLDRAKRGEIYPVSVIHLSGAIDFSLRSK